MLLVLPALAAGIAQSSQLVDLRSLAHAGTDSALVEAARRQTDDTRDALRRLYADAAGAGSDSARAAALGAAERMAAAYAVAWNDSFLVRRVVRFRGLSNADQRAQVAADSLRLAGNAAQAGAGIRAATQAWRESLRRCEALRDSAGMAAALGNIGAGHLIGRDWDSAEAYLERSRALAERVGDFRTLGNATGALGSVAKGRGDLRRASELYARASALRERTGDVRGRAADQNNIALIAMELGDLADARRAFEAALAANRAAGRAERAADNLLNLGNVASREGSYAEADTRYREALAIYREAGNRPDAALVLYNLGLLAMRRGDYVTAVATLADAAATYRRTGPVADEIAVRSDLALARAAAGALQRARAELERAERQAGRPTAALALARGDLAIRFNQLSEAVRQYARAEALARRARDPQSRGAAQLGVGHIELLRDRYPQAEAALDLALRAQQGADDSRAAALTRMLIAYAQRERGDTSSARRALRQSLDTLRRLGDAVGEAAALGQLGDLEAHAGLPFVAESLYRQGLTRLGARSAPDVAWPLHAGVARILRGRGSPAEAAAAYRVAIAEIERMASGIAVEERRAAFLSDKWDVYVELALIERERGRIASAFEASEALRARQQLDGLARGRIGAPGETGRAIATREQDLRRRIAELTVEAEADSGSLRGPASERAASAARDALARAQDAYAELLLEAREASPAYADLVRGRVAPVAEVTAALASDEALLEYLVGDSTTVVFVVTAEGARALDLNVTHETLVGLVDFARGTLANPADSAARRAWRGPLGRLHRYLIEPVEAAGLLAGKRRLLIAPHAELHYLPFAALAGSGARGLLVERYVIAYVPSASVWLQLRARPTSAPSGSVLALAPRPTVLPGSRAEVTGISRIFGNDARVLLGPAASEPAFRSLAPQHGVVHLATYGVLNSHNPLFSYVELGGGSGHDGRLEVHEVYGLSLEARLLVLSACQTGLASGAMADVPAGDDWVGLVQGFLHAGAANVLATLWPVEDVATARLMERFYEQLAAGRSEADALAEAQRATARDARTAHPFFWAGFTLVRGR